MSSALRLSLAPVDVVEVLHSDWHVEALSFHTAPGLLTSHTVYKLAWRGRDASGRDAAGAVEKRYSDLLSLHLHLTKVFPPPRYVYPTFPEKRRFVLLTERDQVATERLASFQVYVTVFSVYPELWDDPKVQRFFELPRDSRGKGSSRLMSPRSRNTTDPAMGSPALRVKPRVEQPPPVESINRSASEELRDVMTRSGSDMYLSQALLEESTDRSPQIGRVGSKKPTEISDVLAFKSSLLHSSMGDVPSPLLTRNLDRGSDVYTASPLLMRPPSDSPRSRVSGAAPTSPSRASRRESLPRSGGSKKEPSPRASVGAKKDSPHTSPRKGSKHSGEETPETRVKEVKESVVRRASREIFSTWSPRTRREAAAAAAVQQLPQHPAPTLAQPVAADGEGPPSPQARKLSLGDRMDAADFAERSHQTPPDKPGDVSPVFARKNKEAVRVPLGMQDGSRIRCLKDFQLHALVGRGGFGSVFLATETATGLVVAVKRMAKSTLIRTEKVDQIQMEVTILKLARIKQNRWIVQLHYSFQDEHYLYLCMQFCPGGDLRNLMDSVEMDERTARAFAAEMCMCVHQLHALGYAHRDLKPDNFLVSQRGHIKLADFGLSEKGYDFDAPSRTRARGKSDTPAAAPEKFSFIVVYFPPSAAEVRPASRLLGDAPVSSDGLVVCNASATSAAVTDHHPDDEDDQEDVFLLMDDKGRRYQRVKVYVSAQTTCADVIDTIKHKLDIRRQIPYQLVEIAFINGHHHERIVRPDEQVESLYASFDQESYRHKFVFRRIAHAPHRNRAMTQESRPAPALSASRAKLFSVVGSPHYMAKEMLQGTGYESIVDWWSIGCIIFEMLYAKSPFDGPTPEAVFSRILMYDGRMVFPPTPDVSDSAKDLISRFISPPDVRLGLNGGLDEVMTHPFFAGISWSELQFSDPPFLPELDSPLDVGYFPTAITEGVEKYTVQSGSFEVNGRKSDGAKAGGSGGGGSGGNAAAGAATTDATTGTAAAPTSASVVKAIASSPKDTVVPLLNRSSSGTKADEPSVDAERARRLWLTWDWSWFS